MELDTLTMDKDTAAQAAKAYAEIRMPTDEEKAILAGYLALTAGKTLINLREVLVAGGEHDNGTPRLAVMDVDRDWCYVARGEHGTVRFSGREQIDGRMRRGLYEWFNLFGRRYDLGWDVRSNWSFRLRAMVPIVPPPTPRPWLAINGRPLGSRPMGNRPPPARRPRPHPPTPRRPLDRRSHLGPHPPRTSRPRRPHPVTNIAADTTDL